MASLKEKIGYALGDAAAGGITWKIMSIAFPLFFTSVFGLTVADTAALMLIARMFDVAPWQTEHGRNLEHTDLGLFSEPSPSD